MKHRPRNTGISGAKYRDKRPGLDELLQGVTRRNFDKVMAWSVDRLGRSLADLLAFCNELRAKGVDLYLHQQHLDTSTPSGRAIFAMCGVFAEFEREIIRERINAGLSRAKAQGKTLGRPRLDEDARLAEIRKLRDQGMGKSSRSRERQYRGLGRTACRTPSDGIKSIWPPALRCPCGL
jgi:DNA invertase Pin-like site-specific DNA recombinase